MATGRPRSVGLQRADSELTALSVQVEGLDLEKNIAGSGAYGVVYRVTVGGKQCIAKKLHAVLAQADTAQQRQFIVGKFRNECRILSSLDHPNVVGFVGVHFGRGRSDISLVMERLHTDLDKFVEKNPDTTLLQRIGILYDVSKGLHYLHTLTPPLIHRDLTAFNILLTEELTAKIADLGVSRYMDPSTAHMAKLSVNPGHMVYMPPESQVKNPCYSIKLDIFSFGNLIIHTINGRLPSIYNLPLDEQFQLSPEGRVELMRRNDSVCEKMSEKHSLYHLVVCCLHDRPEERPTVEEVSATLRKLYQSYPRETLFDACKSGQQTSVLTLIKDGADPNQRNETGATALYVAAQEGHLGVVEMLLEANADIDIKTNKHIMALHIASYIGYDEIVRVLLAANVTTVNTHTKTGESPLHFASFCGHHKVVEQLIRAGANINIQKEDGATALYVAAQNGHLRVVEMLLETNADIDIKTKKHNTALHCASYSGHDEIVRVLLVAKATVNTQDKTGKSPLYSASFHGHHKVVEQLIRAGANINIQKEDGVTALHVAAQEGHLRVVEMLLEVNADIDIKTNNYWTALHCASRKGHDEIVRVLLAAKATVNTQTKTGESPLYSASFHGHHKVVEQLIRAGANINIQKKNGFSALHVAAQEGHLRVVEILLEATNADIDIKTNSLSTPLMAAAYNGHVSVVKNLLSRGANLHLKDKDGNTAYDMAKKNGHITS